MTIIDWDAVPAWVQAIGSVAAIGVAILIGRQSDNRAIKLVRSERDRQATVAASAVAHALDKIERRLRRIRLDLEEGIVTIRTPGKSHGPPHWLLKPERYAIDQGKDIERVRALILTFEIGAGLEAEGILARIDRFQEKVADVERNYGSSEAQTLGALDERVSLLLDLESKIHSAILSIEHAHRLEGGRSAGAARPGRVAKSGVADAAQ